MISKYGSFTLRILAFVLSSGPLAAFAATPPEADQILYSFCQQQNCTDGDEPYAGLIADKVGNLYGTTVYGGSGNNGTVFKLTPPENGQMQWTETVLYSFCSQLNCSDGFRPYAAVIADKAGNLFGTTEGGGSADCLPGVSGCGVVFEITANGTETAIYTFCSQANCIDGVQPFAGLLADSSGNLYGTTSAGGAYTDGVVFKLSPPKKGHTSWTETVLHSFCGTACGDGEGPSAGLVADKQGNLYGTTAGGGASGAGTVFKIAQDGTETVLHSFGGLDGAYPAAGLVIDKQGNFYGTTQQGGNCGLGDYGCGTVFKLASDGTETVLYNFCPNQKPTKCTSGFEPAGGVVLDSKGNLYGTTVAGGGGCFYDVDCGTVFKLATDGQFTVLHAFGDAGVGDGVEPHAGLVEVGGVLYGTTATGGEWCGDSCGGSVFTLGR